MNKRGQFYLIMAVIVIVLIISLAIIVNELKKENFKSLESSAEELKIESQAVLDHISYTGVVDKQNFLDTFARNYFDYSNVDNLYFIFGTSTEVTVAARQKKFSGEILVNDVKLEIEQNTYSAQTYTELGNDIELTINEIVHSFELKSGENFYFVISEGEEDGNYFFAQN